MGLQNDLLNLHERNPLSMAYRVEAMIPVEVRIPSLRRGMYNQEENFALQQYELDLLEESVI